MSFFIQSATQKEELFLCTLDYIVASQDQKQLQTHKTKVLREKKLKDFKGVYGMSSSFKA